MNNNGQSDQSVVSAVRDLLLAGEVSRARQCLLTETQGTPGFLEAEGLIMHATGDGNARLQLANSLAKAPESFTSWFNLATLHLDAGDLIALAELQELAAAWCNDIGKLLVHLPHYISIGDREAAELSVKSLLDCPNIYDEDLVCAVYLFMGHGWSTHAWMVYHGIRDKSTYTGTLALALLLAENTPWEAVKLCDVLLSARPEDTRVWYLRGAASYESREYTACLESMKTLIGLGGENYATLEFCARAALRLGDLRAALAYAEREILLNPALFRGYLVKGDILSHMKRHSEARRAYQTGESLRSL